MVMRKSNLKSLHILFSLAFLYLLFLFVLEFPSLPLPPPSSTATSTSSSAMNGHENLPEKNSPSRPNRLKFTVGPTNPNSSELHKAAERAWITGTKLLSELRNAPPGPPSSPNRTEESCPHSITLPGPTADGKVTIAIPCGLTLGSHLTLIGRPRRAHAEYEPKIGVLGGEEPVMVSQFMMELQGLKTVDGEDPPRILHFNPRLKGDWSGRPVIEMNTCYRMQWGSAQRCEGWLSRADEETGMESCHLSS